MKNFYASLLLFLLTLWPASAGAQVDGFTHVFISEINWGGSSLSLADEWLELHNPTSEDVDLGGWILTGSATNGEALLIADGVVIESMSTLVIANYSLTSEKTTLFNEPDLVTSALSLSNASFEILLTIPDGTVVDQASLEAGSSTPHVSQERDVVTGAWQSAEISMNLSDASQLGTPGWVEETIVNEEIVEEPVVEDVVPTEEVVEDTADPVPDVVPETEPVDVVLETDEEPVYAPCAAVVEGSEETLELEELDEVEVIEATAEEPEELNELEELNEPEVIEATTEVIEVIEGGTEQDEPQAPLEPQEPEEPLEPEEPQQPETDVLITTFAEGSLLINELVSNPTDGVEWIEVFNPGEEVIDITDWTIEDRAGRDTVLSGVVLPLGYFVIEHPNGQLNNDGDEVILRDPNGNVIDRIAYDDNPPKSGESFARTSDGDWTRTETPTPGAKNQFPVVLEESEPDVALTVTADEVTLELDELNEEDEPVAVGGSPAPSAPSKAHTIVAVAKTPAAPKTKGASVKGAATGAEQTTLTGVITALPGTFGRQIAFMEGVQLYFYHADWPELALGDVVRVTGEASSSRGEPRLKISSQDDIVVVGHVTESATEVTIASLETSDEGALVTVSGNMVNREGEKMVFEDATGRITIVAHESTGIRWTDYDGVDLRITGVVRVIEGEIRLYPRAQGDVSEIPEAITQAASVDQSTHTVSKSHGSSPWIGAGIVATSLGFLLAWYAREQKRKQLLSLQTSL